MYFQLVAPVFAKVECPESYVNEVWPFWPFDAELSK
jgi:hypothetical protein